MTLPTENFYARWRSQVCAQNFLRDERFPAERLVQAIWQHQRLRRGELKTAAGHAVRVFHPGFASFEGGPDFRGAVLQIGSDIPRSGDVEVDLRAAGWRAHGHDRNPHFQNVLLHVVWEDDGARSSGRRDGSDAAGAPHPAIVSLKDILDAPLSELCLCLENESLRSLPESLRGKCSAPLRELDEARLSGLLHEAARVRFENKAGQIRARARNAGWEQALWESLFRALGYKHNIWPMQYLAERRTEVLGETGQRSGPESLLALQSRLFGLSGLLPAEPGRRDAGDYLRRIWDFWWRERDRFCDSILPRAAWRFHGLRPANHPARRLALAAHWLARTDFISGIEKWILPGRAEKASSPQADCERLLEVLRTGPDEFWSWHTTFKSARSRKAQPLLGDGRATDLAVNVILPWLWVRAVEGGNRKIRGEVERRYFNWPAAEDNALLKLARQRLLGTSGVKLFKTAAAQQGLIQIVRDFCDHSNAACDGCKFPELVRALV